MDTLPIMMLPGHLSVGARCGLRNREEEETGSWILSRWPW